jgi:hypothetical protein
MISHFSIRNNNKYEHKLKKMEINDQHYFYKQHND